MTAARPAVHAWRYLAGLGATTAAAAVMVAAYLALTRLGTSSALPVAALLALIAIPLAWVVVTVHRGAGVAMFSPKGLLLLLAILVPGPNLIVPYFLGKRLLRHRFPG